MIAIRSDIEATFKRLSMRKGAEILAIEITIGGTKFVVCTVYRVGTVGTLGENNHESIVNSIKTFYGGRNHKKVFIVGDLNLNSVSWPVGENPNVINRVDRLFIDSFYELGLTQCINAPTHSKGKTLDVLLTNCAPLICDTTVLTDELICKSDHFPITFKVQCNIKNKKFPKRKIYNFKRANWDQLNRDLRGIPWNDVIDRTEPEIAWLNFKSIIFNFVNKHIPKITIKCDFDSPWFDSECYEAYRNKERAHKHFKRASNLDNELKKNAAKRVFRNTCDQK